MGEGGRSASPGERRREHRGSVGLVGRPAADAGVGARELKARLRIAAVQALHRHAVLDLLFWVGFGVLGCWGLGVLGCVLVCFVLLCSEGNGSRCVRGEAGAAPW